MQIEVTTNVSHFNSQPHKEADAEHDEYNAERVLFQLTASQGG